MLLLETVSKHGDTCVLSLSDKGVEAGQENEASPQHIWIQPGLHGTVAKNKKIKRKKNQKPKASKQTKTSPKEKICLGVDDKTQTPKKREYEDSQLKSSVTAA